MFITRREVFSSAHKLHNSNISEKENKKIFGKCNNTHGHNFQLFVTVTGKINKKTGFVVDLRILKNIIKKLIIKKLDHKNINNTPFMKGSIASTENLCIMIWKELNEPIKKLGVKLYCIKIIETENNYFKYYGT